MIIKTGTTNAQIKSSFADNQQLEGKEENLSESWTNLESNDYFNIYSLTWLELLRNIATIH